MWLLVFSCVRTIYLEENQTFKAKPCRDRWKGCVGPLCLPKMGISDHSLSHPSLEQSGLCALSCHSSLTTKQLLHDDTCLLLWQQNSCFMMTRACCSDNRTVASWWHVLVALTTEQLVHEDTCLLFAAGRQLILAIYIAAPAFKSSQVKYFFIPLKGQRGCHTRIRNNKIKV